MTSPAFFLECNCYAIPGCKDPNMYKQLIHSKTLQLDEIESESDMEKNWFLKYPKISPHTLVSFILIAVCFSFLKAILVCVVYFGFGFDLVLVWFWLCVRVQIIP